jgi:hypothetical protein
LRVILTGGQFNVSPHRLREGIDGGSVATDEAYDTDDVRQPIAGAGMFAVIRSRRLRKGAPGSFDLVSKLSCGNLLVVRNIQC